MCVCAHARVHVCSVDDDAFLQTMNVGSQEYNEDVEEDEPSTCLTSKKMSTLTCMRQKEEECPTILKPKTFCFAYHGRK